MKLSKYIKELNKLLLKHGDIKMLFTSADDEGNGFNAVYYSPEVRYIDKSEDQHRPDNLIELRRRNESQKDWLENNCLDEEDVSKLKKVVLL